MYRRKNEQLDLEDFILPFGGKLRSNNRWVKLAKLIPWDEIDKRYEDNFPNVKMGAPAKKSRVAFGSLIIKEKLRITDREVVEQIQENPYLQYFLGYECYYDKKPFDSSLMSHFRKRFNLKILGEINELLNLQSKSSEEENGKDDDKNENGGGKPGNKGKLIVDATCTPADIKYPTDLNLLNEAREKSEKIIDILHLPIKGKEKKVRTYRQKARKEYLNVAKNKKPGKKKIRKAIGKQLRYLSRNLKYIKELSKKSYLKLLSKKEYKDLLVIHELYRQQKHMYDNKTHSIEGRIVSISQPHVRPIVRGKTSAKVEFGAKISISLIAGFVYVDRISWEAYNESVDLKEQIENYRRRFGYYPKSVHADRIYRTRSNRNYCKDHGILLSGPALGRPKKDTIKNEKIKKKQIREAERTRIPIEGKIGEGKRRYGLDRIMAKLQGTSETVISVIAIVMNLQRRLVILFCRFVAGSLMAIRACWESAGGITRNKMKLLLSARKKYLELG